LAAVNSVASVSGTSSGQSGIGAAKAQSAKAPAKRMFFLKPMLFIGWWIVML
jgi:hypothetical protein